MKSRLIVAVLGACLAVAVVVSASLAAGGTSIANAPVVVSGQQNFGNTANIPQDSSGYRREYWRLNLIAGDALTLNFGIGSPSVDVDVLLYPAGITDFNVLRTNSVESEDPQSNGKGQLTYSAPGTGTYPLMFRTCCGTNSSRHGPFDFVAYIKHRLKLFIPLTPSVSRTGTIAVQVKSPEGSPISDNGLRVTLNGIWAKKAHKLGTASAANGVAKFKLHLPASLKGLVIRIRAVGQGSNYLGALSSTRAVRVR
jgi:hypothetical protein